MTTQNTGGPAFPLSHEMPPEKQGEKRYNVYFGMTLRDYFAAKAMQMLRSDLSADWCAARAYEMADAMLKARSNT
jgi:hypothetical protein